jgi:type I restriction enzyme S subunit
MTPQELKSSILQLAMQGKLVEQRPEEGVAEELYQQIQAEKQRLIKAGKIKKDKPLPKIVEDEIPFDIPESWKWVRIGTVATILGGKRIPAGRKLSSNDTGHIYIRVSDMKDGYVSTENLQYVPEDIFPSISRYIIHKEDVFITVAGTIGRVGKIPPELDGANLTENADRLVFSLMDQDWLIKCMQSSLIQNQIADAITKVGQPKLAIIRIQNMLIPLPPLAEQHRIVAKIEELLPYIDRYADSYEKLERVNAEFPKDMKKSVLQYAIQGKLVEQRPEEGTGEELYRQIQVEKQKLIKAGKIKKDKPLPEIAEDEIPFDIPESWKWVRFSEIMSVMSTGPFGSMLHKTDYIEKGIPLVNPANMVNGKIVPSDKMMISESTRRRLSSYILHAGMIVLGRRGEMGRCAVVTEKEDGWLCGTGSFFMEPSIRLYVYYVATLFSTPYVKFYLGGESVGTTMSNLNHMILSKMPIPLPPLAEQKRIVAKLEEILPLCE